MDYYLSEILQRIEREKAEQEAALEAWEAVTFPTKKNGEPFAVMSKNFNGATYTSADYAWHDYEKILRVSGHAQRCGYISDSVYCYSNTDYHPFTLDEIKAAVTERIEQLKKYIAEDAHQIEALPAAYEAFKAAYVAAKKELSAALGEHATGYYKTLDAAHSHFRYL